MCSRVRMSAPKPRTMVAYSTFQWQFSQKSLVKLPQLFLQNARGAEFSGSAHFQLPTRLVQTISTHWQGRHVQCVHYRHEACHSTKITITHNYVADDGLCTCKNVIGNKTRTTQHCSGINTHTSSFFHQKAHLVLVTQFGCSLQLIKNTLTPKINLQLVNTIKQHYVYNKTARNV